MSCLVVRQFSELIQKVLWEPWGKGLLGVTHCGVAEERYGYQKRLDLGYWLKKTICVNVYDFADFPRLIRASSSMARSPYPGSAIAVSLQPRATFRPRHDPHEGFVTVGRVKYEVPEQLTTDVLGTAKSHTHLVHLRQTC